MPLTVAEHIAELTKKFPLVGPREASELFFYSHMKVTREHPWTFCIAEGRIVTEAEYGDGTVAATNGAQAIVGTGTAWLPAWTTAPSSRRVIIEGRSESYRLATITNATNATLRDNWVGDTDSGLTYRMYRDTFEMPFNCGYGGEYIIADPKNQRAVHMKNLGSLMDRVTTPWATPPVSPWVARVDLTATGIPQMLFHPHPTSVEVYPVFYFRSATKPANLAAFPDPMFPSDADDVITKRMLLEYVKDPRHKRSDWRDFQAEYDDALHEAKRRFDGGAELDMRLQTTYPDCSDDVFYLTLGEARL